MNETRYLIWSEEHGAWWKPNAGGYTRSISEAGRYTKADAARYVERANKYVAEKDSFNEIVVPDPISAP